MVRACAGERAILDGADPALLDPAGWTDEGGGIYSHAYAGRCFNASAEHVPSGKWTRLYPVESLDALRTRRYRKTAFEKLHIEGAVFCDGTTAHVVLPGPREEYRIRLSAHGRGIVLENRRFIYFDGLEFRNYGKDVYGCAAFLLNSSNILFQHCRFIHNNTGIWVKNACFENTVQDNEFLDDTARWSFNMVKSSYHAHIESGAVYIEGRYSGRGMVIRRNKIAGLFDGAHLGPFIAIGGRTSETDFYRNRVHDVADDFVETDGYSRNVRIFDNFMDKSLSGISLAQALDGPTFVLYNHILNCGVCTATRDEGYEGYPFKTNGGAGHEVGSGHVFFYHNTAWTSDPRSHAILIKSGTWRRLTFRNNIWCGKAHGFVAWPRKPLSPMDFDHDNLYVESNAPLMRLAGNCYATLADVRRATPYLRNGFSLDPRFRDPAGGDFRLAPDSPLISKGILIPGINDRRFRGKAPDIGAVATR